MGIAVDYRSDWLSLDKAILHFKDMQALVHAARNGDLRTRGVYHDDMYSHEVRAAHSDIKPAIWETYSFDQQAMRLEGEDIINNVSFFYCDIEVSKPDIIELYIANHDQFTANQKTEASQIIQKVLKDLIPNNAGKFPPASAVWNAIEARKNEFPAIANIERQARGAKITWRSLAGGDNPHMTYETLENKLKPYRGALKPLLEALYQPA